ncbi:MAG: phosphotransferase [Alphaproteobacteria bacterium]
MKFNFDDVYEIESGASHKKIYRFKNHNEGTILVDFSYNYNDYLSFLEINKFLSMINISVPKIFVTDDTKSIIIMEDFGNNRYDKLINTIDPKEILIDGINSLIEIHNSQKPIENKFLKKYDLATFTVEIAEFADFYLSKKNIRKDVVDEFFYIWKSEFENLNFNWDSFVHKDFELSNLMHLSQRNGHLKCGILDFQNAFIGFSGWDVFSLLENPRIYFDDKYNDELVEYYFKKTNQNLSFNEFLVQYYFLNAARQTRIIGRWINLDKKNKNNNYSTYLDVTIKRLKKSLHNLQNKKLSKLYDKIISR